MAMKEAAVDCTLFKHGNVFKNEGDENIKMRCLILLHDHIKSSIYVYILSKLTQFTMYF